jgi:cytochrome c peroxidase
MSRSKPLQQAVRVKLPGGVTWDQLAKMNPGQIKERGLFPAGFEPLLHPNPPEGGMVLPKFEIDEMKKQEGRDLTRFDIDFNIPEQFLPEFPPPMYLTTRPDLGDVSQGKLVTLDNYYALFNGLLNPKQLEGLRHLVTPFPQQQFHQTEDRRSERASRGIACLRLPRERSHQSGHSPCRGYSTAGLSAPGSTRHRCVKSIFNGCSDHSER